MQPKCYKGKLSKIQFFGLIPDVPDPDFELDFCGSHKKFKDIDKCSNYAINLPGLESEYEIKCLGQNSCGLDVKKFLIYDS
jgi:hypothetical protein